MTSTVSPSPEQPGDLVVRLRKPDAWSAHFHGGGSFTTAEEAAPFEAADALESAQAEIARLTAALTPSAETKAAYMGEFRFQIELIHPRLGCECRSIDVPWATIKEIMAAIRARATLKGNQP